MAIAEKAFESAIMEFVFYSDFEIAVRSKSGVITFDLRSMSSTRIWSVQAAAIAGMDGYLACIVNKSNPHVLLFENETVQSWRLPTDTEAKAVHLMKDQTGMTIGVIDEDNFLWNIGQYTPPEIKERVVTSIARPVVKEVEEKKVVDIKKDKTKQILEILAMPSHQIPNLDDVSINVFDVLLEKRVDERPEDILVHMEEIDLVDDVDAVPLSMQDIAKLRHMFLE
jgi:hypothetical protein